MGSSKVTEKDDLIFQLLEDQNFKVTREGHVLRRNSRGWAKCGWVNKSRNGTKNYIRMRYRGVKLYVHRIVWAAVHGYLNPELTINHKDLNGLNNHINNLEMITPGKNVSHAKAVYRATGMTAAQLRANWRRGRKQKWKWGGKSASKN